jgi:hypothetical protein
MRPDAKLRIAKPPRLTGRVLVAVEMAGVSVRLSIAPFHFFDQFLSDALRALTARESVGCTLEYIDAHRAAEREQLPFMMQP